MEMTCAHCEKGCRMKARIRQGRLLALEGNQCERGLEYAETEALMEDDEEEL